MRSRPRFYKRVSKLAGQIYFMLSPDCTLVKIGFTSRDIHLRAKELNPTGPPLHILEVIEGPRELEFDLHDRYSNLHSHGEWFKYAGELKRFLDIT